MSNFASIVPVFDRKESPLFMRYALRLERGGSVADFYPMRLSEDRALRPVLPALLADMDKRDALSLLRLHGLFEVYRSDFMGALSGGRLTDEDALGQSWGVSDEKIDALYGGAFKKDPLFPHDLRVWGFSRGEMMGDDREVYPALSLTLSYRGRISTLCLYSKSGDERERSLAKRAIDLFVDAYIVPLERNRDSLFSDEKARLESGLLRYLEDVLSVDMDRLKRGEEQYASFVLAEESPLRSPARASLIGDNGIELASMDKSLLLYIESERDAAALKGMSPPRLASWAESLFLRDVGMSFSDAPFKSAEGFVSDLRITELSAESASGEEIVLLSSSGRDVDERTLRDSLEIMDPRLLSAFRNSFRSLSGKDRLFPHETDEFKRAFTYRLSLFPSDRDRNKRVVPSRRNEIGIAKRNGSCSLMLRRRVGDDGRNPHGALDWDIRTENGNASLPRAGTIIEPILSTLSIEIALRSKGRRLSLSDEGLREIAPRRQGRPRKGGGQGERE